LACLATLLLYLQSNMSQFPAALNAQETDIQKMLAASVHLGAKNLDPSMARYLWRRRADGVHLIDLQKTWEKLTLAARIIVAIENPQDVCVISSRNYGQRAVLKYAKYTGAHALAGRYTPGTFTNQIQQTFLEPRLLIVADPGVDFQAIKEAGYVNIPVIAFTHTDNSSAWVDVAIPCNNRGKHSLGLMWWMLCREVLYLRNLPGATRGVNWSIMPDLFFFRDPEDVEKDEAQAVEAARGNATESTEQGGQEWAGQGQDWPQTGGEWTQNAQEPQAAGGNWETAAPQY